MVEKSVINSLPLSSLPASTWNILSSLNSPKIIPSDGVIKLSRDWTGLAFLVNIFSEIDSDFLQYPNPTAKVLEIWQNNDQAATVGELLSHLEELDRYDVYDDIIDDLNKVFETRGISKSKYNKAVVTSNNYNGKSQESEIDTLIYNEQLEYTHIYDAIVLYADEDKAFVAEMCKRLSNEGFRICTVDDLLVGQTAQYAPVVQLISERCRRIILLFSPEFLNSIGMSFYMDYAQTRSIESNVADKKVLPVMYRLHRLPEDHELRSYYKLYYQTHGRPVYDFWKQLKVELTRSITPQNSKKSNGSVSIPPQINVDDIRKPNSRNNSGDSEDSPLLFKGVFSASTSALNSLGHGRMKSADSQSLSNVSQASSSSDVKKKKKSVFSKLALPFTWKSKKNMDSDSDSD